MNVINSKLEKVEKYKGYDVYVAGSVPKEDVATMIPDSRNIPVAIALNPKAYEILALRRDFLERVYERELSENVFEVFEQGCDLDILKFLEEKGYDFGDFCLRDYT